MYYKILPDSDLYSELMKIKQDCEDANTACRAYVEEAYGEGTKWASDNYSIGGGLRAIQLEEKPENYKSVGESWQNFYQPYAKNKKMWREWGNLPKIKDSVLKEALKYGNYSGAKSGGFMMSTLPNVWWKNGSILVKCADFATNYEPVPGMIEILASEFNELKDKD